VENASVSWLEVPHAEVKARSDIMQFFGDKYGDSVRVVQIGGEPRALDGYSMELCGGTHTRATGEIGLFRIVSEGAVAAGVRRIEAVAGLNAYDFATAESERLKALAAKLNAPVAEMEKKVEAMLAQQKELEKQLKSSQLKQAGETARELLEASEQVGSTAVIIRNVGAATGDQLQVIADGLKQRGFKGIVILAAASDESVALVASVSPEFTAIFQAGKIIQAIAPIVGGKGGGRAENARGAGKDASKIDAALERARQILAA
jgi:alanyl-tRNA synthetase